MFLLSDLVLVTLSLSACYCKCREHIPAKICYWKAHIIGHKKIDVCKIT